MTMKRIFVTILYISIWLMIVPTLAFSQETLADRLKNHVYTLASDTLGGRKAGSENNLKAAAYIAAQWKEIGISPLVGDTYYMPFRNQFNNLVGIIEGSHPVLKDEYIVVGAHYDHLGSKEGKNGDTQAGRQRDGQRKEDLTVSRLDNVLSRPKSRRHENELFI